MRHALYRLIVETRTALKCGAMLSDNDLAFVKRWNDADPSHYTDVSKDDQRRIKAIHAHLWPSLSQGDA